MPLHFGVQISDVIAGIVGKHFGFIGEHSLPVLRDKKRNFSQVQLRNLSLLRTIIDRSNEFSEALFHSVAPLETMFKNNAFLHDQIVPVFLE